MARFRIPYTSEAFASGVVDGHGYLETDWDGLLWAALTVGRPNIAYVFAHGDPSYYEALFRLSLVRMAVEQRPFSRALYRTDAFRALDPDGERRGKLLYRDDGLQAFREYILAHSVASTSRCVP